MPIRIVKVQTGFLSNTIPGIMTTAPDSSPICRHRNFSNSLRQLSWNRGSTVVKVLRYKSEGHWFDPRWCHEIFH
jgi:hypothetical protein